jgi:hypothetical protein
LIEKEELKDALRKKYAEKRQRKDEKKKRKEAKKERKGDKKTKKKDKRVAWDGYALHMYDAFERSSFFSPCATKRMSCGVGGLVDDDCPGCVMKR